MSITWERRGRQMKERSCGGSMVEINDEQENGVKKTEVQTTNNGTLEDDGTKGQQEERQDVGGV